MIIVAIKWITVTFPIWNISLKKINMKNYSLFNLLYILTNNPTIIINQIITIFFSSIFSIVSHNQLINKYHQNTIIIRLII